MTRPAEPSARHSPPPSFRLWTSIDPAVRTGLSLVGFLAVGATGLVVNTVLLAASAEGAGIHYLVSAVIATQGSTLWNFVWHHVLIFRRRPSTMTVAGRLARYLLVNNAALLLRAPMLAALVMRLEVHYLAANLLTLLVLGLVRFLLSDRWIWPRASVVEAADAAPRAFRYDIHGILTVESAVALPELGFFRVDSLPRQPDIQVEVGLPPAPALDGETVHVREGLGRFGFELTIVRSGGTRVWVSPLVGLSPHVLYTNVVEPILRWAFVERGYALIHAASIAFGSRAALITAPTDTGKTTTVLRSLRSQSWRFLSDDMTILSPDGMVRNYPKPLTISAHTLQAVPTTRLSLRERAVLAVQSRVHSRDGRRFGLGLARLGFPAATLNALVQLILPPPKYPVGRLVPEVEIAEQARLRLVVVLARGPERQEALTPSALLGNLLDNAEDAYSFPPYASLEGFLSRQDSSDYHWMEREIVRRGLHQATGIRLSSERYRWWKSLPSLLRPGDFGAAETVPTSKANSRGRNKAA